MYFTIQDLPGTKPICYQLSYPGLDLNPNLLFAGKLRAALARSEGLGQAWQIVERRGHPAVGSKLELTNDGRIGQS